MPFKPTLISWPCSDPSPACCQASPDPEPDPQGLCGSLGVLLSPGLWGLGVLLSPGLLRDLPLLLSSTLAPGSVDTCKRESPTSNFSSLRKFR